MDRNNEIYYYNPIHLFKMLYKLNSEYFLIKDKLRNLPIMKLTSGYLAQITGITPASKSIPFRYTSLLITTTTTRRINMKKST